MSPRRPRASSLSAVVAAILLPLSPRLSPPAGRGAATAALVTRAVVAEIGRWALQQRLLSPRSVGSLLARPGDSPPSPGVPPLPPRGRLGLAVAVGTGQAWAGVVSGLAPAAAALTAPGGLGAAAAGWTAGRTSGEPSLLAPLALGCAGLSAVRMGGAAAWEAWRPPDEVEGLKSGGRPTVGGLFCASAPALVAAALAGAGTGPSASASAAILIGLGFAQVALAAWSWRQIERK